MAKSKAPTVDEALPTVGGKTHKVPILPAVKSIDPEKHEITVDADKLSVIAKVRTFEDDANSFRSRIKTLNEQIQDELDDTDEYAAVTSLMEKLEAARGDLKRALQSNSTYMGLVSELADERLALRDAEQNISDFLKGYYAETHEEQIELAPKVARAIVIKAKLGKAQLYQTNMFSRPPADEDRKDLQ